MSTTLLTTEDLAARWQVSTGHLANLRSAAKGPRFARLGRSVRYRLADVEAYEDARLQVTTDDEVSA